MYLGFPTRSKTNQTAEPQKMVHVRGLKFGIEEVEGLYYLFRKNKGTDQLCSCKKQFSHLMLTKYIQ